MRRFYKALVEFFTPLAKVLIVLVLLGFLAGLLVPAVGGGGKPPTMRARREIQQMDQAIMAYNITYSGWPMSSDALRDAVPDFTYGTYGMNLKPSPVITSDRDYQANNAEVVAIVMAHAKAPYNTNHRHNPQKKQFLDAKFASEDGKPGVGPNDRVYRDPWGMPYILSIDVDGDGWTRDAFYCRSKVSQPPRSKPDPRSLWKSRSGLGTNDYEFNGRIMIWSFGPDRRADPEIPWDEGANADNVLSWR